MAWRSSGTTNSALISNLAENGLVKSDRVRKAMLRVLPLYVAADFVAFPELLVDRAHYAPELPYQDSPQSIGFSATISAPHMHASAAESLLPFLHPTSKVLDVGSGSGYLTHVLANLIEPEGKVVGVDHIQGLVDMANRNMGKSTEGKGLIKSGRVRFFKADGRKGWPEGAPYDAIHVGAAAVDAHGALIEQLKAPGRLFIPVGDRYSQHIWVIDKKEDGSVEKQKSFGVMYVPLTDPPKN
ncbi:hypothetical protein MMC13_005808 [Lambiella insularis]|nr:hypothetical protein [Lambiella insularis]